MISGIICAFVRFVFGVHNHNEIMHVDKVISQLLLSCVILHESSYIFSFRGAHHFLCGSWWLHFCARYGVPRRSICQNTQSRVLLLVKYILDGPDITFQKSVDACFFLLEVELVEE